MGAFMGPEIIKKIEDDRRQEEERQIPLYIPVPQVEDQNNEEEVSTISKIIIDM